ncbi:hypothetical protein PENVUL_c031G04398 [Penicillium vulpinum]|uniref:Exonuclease domain-containing protein n=1 Tax=Penicillium vulpinum TaxID=29845 RepID=A0A1V6RSN4_9EURO|nr:hypothetical protein PENVUL_c031G04398 [Penicillium vulpinum]
MTGDINPNLSVAEQEQLFDQLLSKVHPDELLWRQHFTTISTCIGSRRPAGGIIACNEFLSSPVPDATKAKRQALALDCEMVGVESGLKELAYLAVVDILTGEVLVNAFVSPTRVVQKWNTRWSGIRYTDMKTAVKKRVAIKGWKAARSMLFEHMDSKTILAGHALHNDLNVLGILHPTIVDTAIIKARSDEPPKCEEAEAPDFGVHEDLQQC